MLNEDVMRAAMQEYIDAFNRDDVEAIIALYADDATVEDPVGSEPKRGIAEISDFYRMAIKTGAKLSLSAPIRCSHGNAAAMAFEVRLQLEQGPSLIRVIDVMTFAKDGRFASMQAYWGPSDLTPA